GRWRRSRSRTRWHHDPAHGFGLLKFHLDPWLRNRSGGRFFRGRPLHRRSKGESLRTDDGRVRLHGMRDAFHLEHFYETLPLSLLLVEAVRDVYPAVGEFLYPIVRCRHLPARLGRGVFG